MSNDTRVRWTLDNSIGYLTRLAFRSYSALIEQRTRKHGVTVGQWRFLRQLWVKDGITQRELSVAVGMREPTTVVALKGLVKSGLVFRRASETDRRKMHVHLTDHANSLRAPLVAISAEVNELATRGFTAAEIDTLRTLLRRAIDNMAEEAAAAPQPHDTRP